MNYIDHKLQRKFEEKHGWKKILEYNKKIGDFLGFKPEIEYSVGTDHSYCYSPKNIGYSWPPEQKVQAEKWLNEHKKRNPESDYKLKKDENYPYFHLHWADLIEAICRMHLKGIDITIIPTDIFKTYETLLENIK